jgi:hypothetical protein
LIRVIRFPIPAAAVIMTSLAANSVWALGAGSVSGSIKDTTGAAVPGAEVTLAKVEHKTVYQARADSKGFNSFPAVPTGRYDLRVESPGFATQENENLSVDTDAALRVDFVLRVGERKDVVTVTAAEEGIDAQPDMVSTQLGEVIREDKSFHGDAFEFLRNADLQVPSMQDRSGDLSDLAGALTSTVSGPYIASLLTGKLGYPVFEGERYYTPGCASPAACVFPGAVIRRSAWSTPALQLLKYIPVPNAGGNLFVTSAYPETVGDVIATPCRTGRITCFPCSGNFRRQRW